MDLFQTLLPMSFGVAVSPLPIIGAIVICVMGQASVKGWSYVGGWMLSIIALAFIGAFLSWLFSKIGAPSNTFVGWVQIILGGVMLLLAYHAAKSIPKKGEEPVTPGWLKAIEGMDRKQSFNLGLVLGITNLKNIPLVLSATTAIIAATSGFFPAMIALAVFVLIGSSLVALPIVLVMIFGARVDPFLNSLHHWLIRYNGVIMLILFGFLGLNALGGGIDLLRAG